VPEQIVAAPGPAGVVVLALLALVLPVAAGQALAWFLLPLHYAPAAGVCLVAPTGSHPTHTGCYHIVVLVWLVLLPCLYSHRVFPA